MKTRFYSLVAILLIFSAKALQAQVVDWISADCQFSYGTAFDPFDNSYSFAVYSGTITVGGNSFTDLGANDLIVVKYSPTGSVLWATSIGSPQSEFTGDIVYDGVGNIWVSGSTEGNLTAGSFTLTNNGSSDMFLVKLSAATGAVLHASNGGGSASDDANDIATDGAGNVWVFGDNRSANFNWGGMTSAVSGAIDVVVVKFDNSGTPQWLRTIGGNAWEFTYTGDVDANGNFYVGGHTTSSTMDFNGTSVATNSDNHFVTKFDNAGNYLWHNLYFGGGNIYGFAVDNWGNSYFTGAGGPDTLGSVPVTGIGSDNIFIAKVTPSGGWSWGRRYGGSGYEEGLSVDCDGNGNLFVTGRFEGTMTMGGFNLVANSGTQGVVSKLDSAGNVKWALASRGSSAPQYFRSVRVNSSNDIFITGFGGSYIALANDSVALNRGFQIRMADSANVIKGKVFADVNNNGTLDAGEGGVPNTILQLNSGTYFTNANNNGDYEFYTFPGTYSVGIPNIPLYHTLTTGSTQSATFAGIGGLDSANHFGLYPTPGVNDLRVDITPVTLPKAGKVLRYMISYKNVGTTDLNATITLQSWTGLTYLNAFPTPTSQSGGVTTWDLGLLPAQVLGTMYINFEVPTTAFIGDTVPVNLVMDPVSGDQVPSDNSVNTYNLVVGPYDPNYKKVEPETIYDLSGPSWLMYEVHFQNLGNAPAEDVRIFDTLSTYLDLSTLEIVSHSHTPMNLIVENDNVVKFVFPGIELPDSASDPVGSNGFVKFRIQQDGTLPLNQAIENFADIYFDYNPPIRTNTAYTWNRPAVGISEGTFASEMVLFPNPTSGQLSLDLGRHFDEVTIEVMDLAGRTLQRGEWSGVRNANLKIDPPAGVYLVRVSAEGKTAVFKVVKE